MKSKLIFHPEVPQDLIAAVNYYNGQKAGLGKQFMTAARRTQSRVRATPKMHQMIWKTVRRSLVERFPYGFFYRVVDDGVEVIAVCHLSRDPAGWRSRA
jgi:toxin ParE1/3/4